MTVSEDFLGADFDALCGNLTARSSKLEDGQIWPDVQFEQLAQQGVLGWAIPQQYGGQHVSAMELTRGYERLAAACLVTTFVLTQRNGACQRIARAENENLKADLLPKLCRGEIFATVGISHLTTSRRHVKEPAVSVALGRSGGDGSKMVLNGTIPWVTGAAFADYIVTGGVCDDGREVLIAMPCRSEGVQFLPPAPMLALNASQTGSVRLTDVEVDQKFVLAGPAADVMSQGVGGGTGSLATSALALGAVAGILDRFQTEVDKRPELAEIYDALSQERIDNADEMYQSLAASADDTAPPFTNEEIRQKANSLILRASQAFLTATKGAGFVTGHPAERAVREAMFFLVWSCPQVVAQATMRSFACGLSG